jgi:primosomal protein N' (replication factor Y)
LNEALKADVAVPVPIDKTLAYLVPQELEPAIDVGTRVVVPLRGKYVTGFVLGLSPGRVKDKRLKSIKDIADTSPVLTKELLRLAAWMSGYYVAPIGEVLASMSPPPVRFKRVYRIKHAPGDLELEIIRASDPLRAKIIEILKPGRPLGLDTIKRKAGKSDIDRDLAALEKEGFITHEVAARRRRGSRLLSGSPGGQAPGEYGKEPTLTVHQQKAFDGITAAFDDGGFRVFVILGVTGSGKTEVYLRCIDRAVRNGKKAIYLVPEIALTPQIMERVRQRFGGRSAVLHSRLSDSERYDTWQRILSGAVDVVVGARSAVFAPVADLGIIVVDEEHDTSYKQQDSPRYNAREVAIMRAREAGAVAVLGSATPTVETYHNALDGKYGLYELPERISGGKLPQVHVIDMRQAETESPLSAEAEKALQASVEGNEQVLLFLNRRGFSNFVQCKDCGFVPRCRNCYVTLTYHIGRRDLRCHYCGYSEPGFDACPRCGGADIVYVGLGTQRVEDYIASRFPQVTCARFDRDATRKKGSTEAVLSDFGSGMVRFLVGTQMLAKGHDFKRVGLVIVVNADVSMNLPDFRSGERTFQILTQVAGRAGRGEIPGKVVIQTFNPDHHSLSYVTSHDFKGFYEEEAPLRQELGYPPFARLVRIVVEAKKHAQAESAARRFAALASRIAGDLGGKIVVIGPSRAPISKVRNVYRWHLILKGEPGRNLSPFVRKCMDRLRTGGFPNAVRFGIDVDPQVMI